MRGLDAFASEHGQKLALRLFQRTPASSIEYVEMVLVREGQAVKLYDVPIAQAPSLAREFLAADPLSWPSSPLGPELFVCTDGKHDACCARLGRPLFKSLLQLRAETGHQIEISEASHLGGHRFAANCLLLPQGYLYGRVTLADATELLRLSALGECFHARLRGRTGRSELGEIAESFLRARDLLPTGETGEGRTRTGELRWTGDDCEVQIYLPDGRCYWVHCAMRAFESPKSCGDARCQRMRWVPIGLREMRADEQPAASASAVESGEPHEGL